MFSNFIWNCFNKGKLKISNGHELVQSEPQSRPRKQNERLSFLKLCMTYKLFSIFTFKTNVNNMIIEVTIEVKVS